MTATKNMGVGICYSRNGHWKPTIPNQTCVECGIIYTAHRHGQKFCSKVCSGRSKRGAKVEHTERTCPGCGVKWSDWPSNPSQYCSKECLFESGRWTKPEERECEQCGVIFLSRFRRERMEWMKFCSHKCVSLAAVSRVRKTCAACGDEFEVHTCRADETTCSVKCRRTYYRRDRHHAWTGGAIDQANRPFRRIDREGYAAKYDAESRMVTAREIGRQLVRGEVVLCIDKNPRNIDARNLFLCPNQSEAGLIKVGAVEWPKASNLQGYRSTGYIRPDVVLVLHDWDHPKPQRRGKLASRHPQADEIIKRRMAGATVQQLAEAFGMSKSGMAGVVRNRL